jgi:TRAP-type mannitol/chloroaromatic compound transport system substrate-binding protein
MALIEYKAANEVYAEIAAANPRFNKIYENLVAFRTDRYLYWQVACYLKKGKCATDRHHQERLTNRHAVA